MKSNDLFDIGDICDYFGISEATVRRRIRERKEGIGTFPLPLFKAGCRVLWRKDDVLAWRGEADAIDFTSSPVPQIPHVLPINATQVRKGLEALGIKFDKPINN